MLPEKNPAKMATYLANVAKTEWAKKAREENIPDFLVESVLKSRVNIVEVASHEREGD